MSVKYVAQCKVCNSKFRNIIESLHNQGMSPQKIFDYLRSLTDPNEIEIVEKENINPSSIRRHMDRHFDVNDGAKIKVAETKNRIKQSRETYKQGVQIVVNKVNTISHLIDTAMIKLEEVDEFNNLQKQHQYTIQYMNTIKGLIESLAKLTGDLKQEGTIDITFFSDEITRFAEIVLSTIREMDKTLNLQGMLEQSFSNEFKKQWDNYKLRQNKILDGELSTNDGQKERNVNTFNEIK